MISRVIVIATWELTKPLAYHAVDIWEPELKRMRQEAYGIALVERPERTSRDKKRPNLGGKCLPTSPTLSTLKAL